jgi:DNA polymerase-3 subunit epsilon
MASYFVLHINMNQARTEAKAECTWCKQYYCEDATGVCSVNLYESGFVYFSPVLTPEQIGKRQIRVPQGAVPCTAAEYAAAYAKLEAFLAAKREKHEKAAALAKLLKSGKLYAPAPEPVPFLSDFTVFDTETTGTDPHRNRITELAAVRYVNWEPVGQMQTFMRCDHPVPAFITKLTGITTADVVGAPLEKSVLREFRQLAGDSLLVGHNVAFDVRMLEGTRQRMGATDQLPNLTLCTYAVAAHRYPGPHKLPDLCARFGINNAGAHRAMVDVQMTFALLRHMQQEAPISPELIGASAQSKKTPTRKAAAKPAPTSTLFSAPAELVQ